MKKNFIKATYQKNELNDHVPAPYFRKSFSVEKKPEAAEISICGLGFYRLYINGKDITKGPLAPYISNPDHYCYVDKYDITDCLTEGENVIGILLGNGFMNPVGGAVWDFDKVDWAAPPCLALECTLKNGEDVTVINADTTFKTHSSPILFDEIRFGEIYDARLELDGWNRPGFDDSDWENAIPADRLRGEFKECSAEPIAVTKRLKPISITKEDDGYLYDFGLNSAGVCLLNIDAEAGQTVRMHHGERLIEGKFNISNLCFNSDIAAIKYLVTYTARGGRAEYIPSFTYFGFRYILVTGITEEQATEDLLTYLVMSSDIEKIGSFSCSDERINTLYSMVDNALRSNFYYIQTDCPHREKNGWTGDASMSADFCILMYDTEKSWREWLNNIRKAMRDDGALPGIVPTGTWGFAWGNGPTWDSILFNLPYQLYKFRGCTDVIKENAVSMMRYLNYIIGRRDEKGLVAVGLGDWVPVGKSSSKYDVPLAFTDSVMVMDMARKAEEMFRAVGLTNYADYAHRIYEEMRAAIRLHLIDFETMTVSGSCQSGQAIGVYYDVFNEDEKSAAVERLVEFIHAKDDAFDCGFIGMHTIFHALSEFGYGELAFAMITRKEFPSYTQLIDMGHTAMIEQFRFASDGGTITSSHNHHFLGDINRWFTFNIAGLRPVGTDKVVVCPDFISSIDSAKASYKLPAGEAEVAWERKNGEIFVTVTASPAVKVELSEKLSCANVTVERKK